MASPFRITSRVWLCSLLLLAFSGSNAQQRPKVTGFFTDMHYIEGAGDLLGTEVWIVYARGGFWATVQMAEGEPDPPAVVPVEVSGSRVKFTIREPRIFGGTGKPAPDFVLNFDGTVSKAGLLFTSSPFDPKPVLLKRGNSYWQ
jgi:hypothetical protein